MHLKRDQTDLDRCGYRTTKFGLSLTAVNATDNQTPLQREHDKNVSVFEKGMC